MHLLRNHILLIFKFCVYKNRSDTLNFYVIINLIKSTFKIEKNILSAEKFEKKWSSVREILQ